MSATPDELEPARDDRDALACEVEALAEQLVALVEEFEAKLSEGQVPPAFAERLAQLRESAKWL